MPEASKTLWAVALAAIGGGVLGGAISAFAVNRPASERPAKERVAAARESGDAQRAEGDAPEANGDVSARLAQLEGALQALKRQRAATAQLRQYAESLAQGAADGGDSADLAPVVDAEDPAFELAVRTVMDRIDWERDEEERVTRAQRQQERAKHQADLLAQRLGLNETQRRKVEPILVEQMDAFRALRDPDGDAGVARPTTRSEWRERLAAVRTAAETKLAAVLDQKQMQAYQQFVDQEGFGPRGGRGGRRRGGN
jgi:hypothetical protein